MNASRQLIRLIVVRKCFNRLCSTTVVAPTSNTTKEALKELRKKTGYSYVNCRKALNNFGPDNLDEAIKWLKKQAIEEGWEKAAKLGDRPTRQGVVSVIVKDNKAAVVELNCETDFVSRNEDFKRLVEDVVKAVLHAADRNGMKSDGFELLNSSINSLKTSENGKLVKDLIMEAIGKLGENITLSRAQLILAPSDVQLFGYAHPKEGTDTVCMGRYVSIVGLKGSNKTNFPIEKLGQQLCQHIVGMRSLTLGTPLTVEEITPTKEEEEVPQEDESNAFYDGEVTHIDGNETQLLRQAFMLNPSQTVHEYAAGHGASIIDFYRVELSENVNEKSIQS